MSTKREEEFLHFYLDKGWFTPNTIRDIISHNRSNERDLHDSLDVFVRDRAIALDTLIKISSIADHPGKQSWAFKLYYYFATGDWLDDYRPQQMKKAGKSAASKSSKKAGKSSTKPISDAKPRVEKAKWPLNLPVQGRDDSGCGGEIRYDDDITDEEQVPGLLECLSGEYEAIIATARRLYNCDLRSIQVIISKETPTKKYPINKAKRIKYLFELKGKDLSEEEINKVINEDKFCDRIAGIYYNGETGRSHRERRDYPHPEFAKIIIYYRNFTADTLQEYVAKAGNVLAHEYMHYVHNVRIGNNEFNRKFKEASFIKEAVADFFGMWYMLRDRGIYVHDTEYRYELAKERYDLWLERQGTDWPYWYALYFYRVNDVKYPFSINSADYYSKGIIEKNLAVYNSFTIEEAYQKLLTL